MAWNQNAKIDAYPTLGLLGTSNSLAYRVHEIEKHFHSGERWLGKKGTQTATDWADEDVVTPYRAISGEALYGADTGDEALVIGTADGPFLDGGVKFDAHRLFILTLSTDELFTLRVVWGTGTMDAAVSANQFSTVLVQNNPAGSKAGGAPVEVMMPRRTYGTDKIWIQAKAPTDNAYCDFFIGIHEYAG